LEFELLFEFQFPDVKYLVIRYVERRIKTADTLLNLPAVNTRGQYSYILREQPLNTLIHPRRVVPEIGHYYVNDPAPPGEVQYGTYHRTLLCDVRRVPVQRSIDVVTKKNSKESTPRIVVNPLVSLEKLP
jgi:hypothetical protein